MSKNISVEAQKIEFKKCEEVYLQLMDYFDNPKKKRGFRLFIESIIISIVQLLVSAVSLLALAKPFFAAFKFVNNLPWPWSLILHSAIYVLLLSLPTIASHIPPATKLYNKLLNKVDKATNCRNGLAWGAHEILCLLLVSSDLASSNLPFLASSSLVFASIILTSYRPLRALIVESRLFGLDNKNKFYSGMPWNEFYSRFKSMYRSFAYWCAIIFASIGAAVFGTAVWFLATNFAIDYISSYMTTFNEVQVFCLTSLISVILPLIVIDAIADTKLPNTTVTKDLGEQMNAFKQIFGDAKKAINAIASMAKI